MEEKRHYYPLRGSRRQLVLPISIFFYWLGVFLQPH